MRKDVFLRRKINIKCVSQPGLIQWMQGMYFVLILSVLIVAVIQQMKYQATGDYMEDALAASNLASAIVDLQEYGMSHKVQIINPSQAYAIYCRALKGNLNLDDTWQCSNKALISGPVQIIRYIIYNVSEDDVQICEVQTGGIVRESRGNPGQVLAPNGLAVEHTSVYSEIGFTVRGIWNTEVPARKGKLIDIVAEG